MNAVLDQPFPKVDDQAQLQSSQTKTGQQLCHKYVIVLRRRLAFHDHEFADDEINLERSGKPGPPSVR
jgi:hypothetical protein